MTEETVTDETVTLWRPTGPAELALVRASGWRRWPPRLPEQPIFYPVLDEDYAVRIARDRNVPHSGVGYVTRFAVRREFLDGYEVHQVGGSTILEYWIPADDLDDLNANIVGQIEVVHEVRSDPAAAAARTDGAASGEQPAGEPDKDRDEAEGTVTA